MISTCAKPVKMFVTDLDGTLLNRDSQVSDKHRQALKELKEKGILVVIATGRSIYHVRQLVRDWQIEPYVDYILGCNSAQILNMKTGEIQSQYTLDSQQTAAALRAYRFGSVKLIMMNDRVYSRWYNPLAIAYAWRSHMKFCRLSRREFKKAAVDRIMVFAFPPILRLLQRIVPKGWKVYKTSSILLEIFHPQLSKSRGIARLARQHQILPEEILVFGDDENDVEMLADYHGVAMANAKKAASDAASFIAPANTQNGIYTFLKENHII